MSSRRAAGRTCTTQSAAAFTILACLSLLSVSQTVQAYELAYEPCASIRSYWNCFQNEACIWHPIKVSDALMFVYLVESGKWKAFVSASGEYQLLQCRQFIHSFSLILNALSSPSLYFPYFHFPRQGTMRPSLPGTDGAAVPGTGSRCLHVDTVPSEKQWWRLHQCGTNDCQQSRHGKDRRRES